MKEEVEKKKEDKGKSKLVLFSQYSVLFFLAVALTILLIIIFKGGKGPFDNAVSVLEVLVAILIIMGFELMININNVVSDWFDKIGQVETMINQLKDKHDERLDNLEQKIIKVDEIDKLSDKIKDISIITHELIKLEDIPLLIEFISRYYDFFRIVAETFGFMIENKTPSSGNLQPYEEADRENHRKAWEFSRKAAYLFQPLDIKREEDIRREINEAIIYFQNNVSKPSCEVLKMRYSLSRNIMENLKRRKFMLEHKNYQYGCKFQEKINEIEQLIKIEEQIQNSINDAIANMRLYTRC